MRSDRLPEIFDVFWGTSRNAVFSTLAAVKWTRRPLMSVLPHTPKSTLVPSGISLSACSCSPGRASVMLWKFGRIEERSSKMQAELD
jgi:hypothetical protein